VLDDETIERFARQIVVPAIGVAGQQRLLESTFVVVGNRRGCEQARLYLKAAGLHEAAAADAHVDVVVAAGAAALSADERKALLARDVPICWYEVDAAGFSAGVHPSAPLPAESDSGDPCADGFFRAALHDAGACDAAATACAVVLGLSPLPGPWRCEL